MYNKYIAKADFLRKIFDPKPGSMLDSSSQIKSLQRKADLANNATQRAEAPRPNNTGMPDNLKSGIESLSGFSMDDVRVHYNSNKPATVQALAYTQGTDIHVAPGQEKCLPHEAWHVAQQMAGRVSPTTNINGMPVNDNAALEHEADVMGEKAVGQMLSTDEKKYHNIGKFTIAQSPFQEKTFSNNSNLQRVAIDIQDDPYESSFKTIIEGALEQIKNTYCVSAIRKTEKNEKYNWKDILICNQYGADGSGFENGAVSDDRNYLLLFMDIGECENMYWGEMNESIKKGNSGIPVTLLHELGHAYQYYLNLDSFETDNDLKKKNEIRQKVNLASTIKNMQVQKDIPDFFCWIKQIIETENADKAMRELITAANAYYGKSVIDITSQLSTYLALDSEQRKSIKEEKESCVVELINKICDDIINASENQDLSGLTRYPLLFECISQIYEEKSDQIADGAMRRLIKAANAYYGESVFDITSQLSTYLALDSEQRKSIKEDKRKNVNALCCKISTTLESMASTAANPTADADNMFMNEIPFAVEHNKKETEKIGVRRTYCESTDIRDKRMSEFLLNQFELDFAKIQSNNIDEKKLEMIRNKAKEINENYYLSTTKQIWNACAQKELEITWNQLKKEDPMILREEKIKEKLEEKNSNINDRFCNLFDVMNMIKRLKDGEIASQQKKVKLWLKENFKLNNIMDSRIRKITSGEEGLSLDNQIAFCGYIKTECIDLKTIFPGFNMNAPTLFEKNRTALIERLTDPDMSRCEDVFAKYNKIECAKSSDEWA